MCYNSIPTYFLSCFFFCSYEGDGQTCTDMNECALNLASCAQDAECVNTVGSFACQCKDGFTGDGEICLGKNLRPDNFEKQQCAIRQSKRKQTRFSLKCRYSFVFETLRATIDI